MNLQNLPFVRSFNAEKRTIFIQLFLNHVWNIRKKFALYFCVQNDIVGIIITFQSSVPFKKRRNPYKITLFPVCLYCRAFISGTLGDFELKFKLYLRSLDFLKKKEKIYFYLKKLFLIKAKFQKKLETSIFLYGSLGALGAIALVFFLYIHASQVHVKNIVGI